MNLYEINEVINEVLEKDMIVDEETGEVIFDEEDLAELEMEREEKIENLILYIKNLNAEAAAVKAEKLSLADRQKKLEAKADRLKDFVQQILDGSKFSTGRCSVQYRKTVKVDVDDRLIAPEWCKVSYAPDKSMIKKALQNGEPVMGARLIDSVSMSIR